MEAAQRPSTAWYWWAAVLVLVGVVGAAAWGFGTYRMLQHRLDALPRTGVPGEVTVGVDGPTGLTVFYEDPNAPGTFIVQADAIGDNTLASSPVTVTVTGPSGPVPTAAYATDLRFDVNGRVATALKTFDAPTAGTYTVQVAGDVPAGVQVSVGHVVDTGLLANAAGAIVLFIASIPIGLIVVLVTAVRRRRAPQPVEAPPPLTRV